MAVSRVMSRWSSARLSDRSPRSTQAAHPPKACGDRRGVLASAAANPAEDALEVEILQRIWCSLAAAASRRSPFTLMQFATVDENNAPKLRTIVVRGFDERTGRIEFSTNVGSRKVAEVSTNRLPWSRLTAMLACNCGSKVAQRSLPTLRNANKPGTRYAPTLICFSGPRPPARPYPQSAMGRHSLEGRTTKSRILLNNSPWCGSL
jgi:pyridoxamine 5'-phosphate oxidase-like protein